MALVDRTKLIQESLEDLHKNESLERALGRAVRRHKGTYRDYIEIVGELRDIAEKERVDILEAAKRRVLRP